MQLTIHWFVLNYLASLALSAFIPESDDSISSSEIGLQSNGSTQALVTDEQDSDLFPVQEGDGEEEDSEENQNLDLTEVGEEDEEDSEVQEYEETSNPTPSMETEQRVSRASNSSLMNETDDVQVAVESAPTETQPLTEIVASVANMIPAQPALSTTTSPSILSQITSASSNQSAPIHSTIPSLSSIPSQSVPTMSPTPRAAPTSNSKLPPKQSNGSKFSISGFAAIAILIALAF